MQPALNPAAGHRLDWHAVDRAPPPVRRYLHMALQDCSAPIATARFTQRGRLRASLTSARWMPFDAQQMVRPLDNAFTWIADVRAFGPLRLHVVDRLQGGHGSGEARVWGMRVAASTPCHEMDSGALHRFLAEAVWYPTVLIPSAQLTWTGLGETRATATLTTATAAVDLEFRFDGADQVASIHAPARWGRFGGRFEQHGWEGHFGRYEWIDGVRVPRRGDVGWTIGPAWQCVWDGEVVTADYEWGGA